MTEADVSHPPGTTVYRCPLPSCEWTFTQAPPDPFAPGPVVAVVAGESLDESIARASMAILRGWYAESERAIEAHLTTHTTLEFVTEISRLNGIISDVARDLADGGAYRLVGDDRRQGDEGEPRPRGMPGPARPRTRSGMTTTCRYCRLDIRDDGGEWRLIWPAMNEDDSDEADPFDCDGIPAIPGRHAPKVERDEVLEAEVRDQYRDLGLDEDSVREAMATARDAGMFEVRDWA